MTYFEGMNARVREEMSVDVIDMDDAVLPLAWQVMPGLRAKPDEDSFVAPVLDREGVKGYVEGCKEMLKGKGQVLLEEIGDSAQHRSEVLVAQGPIREALRESWNGEIGRPSKPITKKLSFAAGIMPFIKSAQKLHSEDPVYIQSVMCLQMANLGKNLDGLHWMFFEQNCADGRPSVGWLSEQEKTSFLKALDQLSGEGRRAALANLWGQLGGAAEAFPAIWAPWEAAVQEWKDRFEAIPFAGTLRPIGEEATGLFAAQWGIRTQVDRLIALADEDIEALDEEILRVSPKTGPANSPSSDEDVLIRAREGVQRFKEQLVDSGILPQLEKPYEPSAVSIVLKKDEELMSPDLAAVGLDGVMHLYPYEGHEDFWAAYGGTESQVVRHELIHQWQYTQIDETFKNRWVTPFALEASAVSFETSTVGLEENPSPELVLVALKDERRRAAMAAIALRFHSEKIDREEAREQVRNTGMDEENVERFFMRMEAGASDVVQYWLGSKLFSNFVDADHAGDLKAALTDYAHRSLLLLPPHVIQSGFVPGEHEVQSSVPLIVRIAKEKIAA